MRDAVRDLVRDGDTVAIEGFTHLISFAAGHEIIRQRKRDLTLARLTPDLVYDQMIAAGVARKLIFSWLGNPGVGGLGAIRRRVEGELPDQPLELEEYSHFGMVGRYTAGAMNLPFFPLRSYFETDLPVANPLIRQTTPGLEFNKWGNLIVDENCRTSIEGVYAGGDIVLGAATVILAMGQGRIAAAAINKYLAEKKNQ